MFPQINIDASFADLKNKLFEIFSRDMTNPYLRGLLKDYKQCSEISKTAVLLFCMHGFFFHQSRVKVSRYNVMDAPKFMILRANSQSTIDEDVNEWKRKLNELKFSFQPIIICTGEDTTKLDPEVFIIKKIKY
jgi:hypothetical protein